MCVCSELYLPAVICVFNHFIFLQFGGLIKVTFFLHIDNFLGLCPSVLIVFRSSIQLPLFTIFNRFGFVSHHQMKSHLYTPNLFISL